MAQHIAYADALPHAVAPFWHTLRVELNGSALSAAAAAAAVRIAPAAAAAAAHAAPSAAAGAAAARPPRAPHRLEWRLTLPPFTSAQLTLQFERPLLPVDALPADASRGLDLGAAAVRHRAAPLPASPGGRGGEARLLFTESALLMLPLADQSMPYNVISITGTLVALFSGSMFNLLTRRRGGRPRPALPLAPGPGDNVRARSTGSV